jgi:hypothetical protein
MLHIISEAPNPAFTITTPTKSNILYQAMVASLMTLQATRHPLARGRPARSLEEVLRSRRVAPVTNTLECAKRADGGAALIVASPELARKWGLERGACLFCVI